MVRQWTDEQRAEASRRAKERGFGRVQTAASVEVVDVPPVGKSAEVFLAQHEGIVDTIVDREVSDDGNPVTTTHTRPGTMVMYKPFAGGYAPRTVSVSALRLLLRQGWSEHCPSCGKPHLDKNGNHSTDPNLCTARPALAVILCPVCRLRIYDNMPFEEAATEDDDKNVITPDDLQASTPEQRLIAARNLHMWLHHPRSAQERNLPPLPAALRDMVAEPRPV